MHRPDSEGEGVGEAPAEADGREEEGGWGKAGKHWVRVTRTTFL